jgi:UDP-N-acetylglucosamine 2-epimerase (non-hydrolysing)
MKALFVYGTRPEAIKMAPVVQAMKLDPRFEPVVCLTGQHREMLDQVNEFFEIQGDYDLKLMAPGQDLFDVTSKALLGLREILKKEKPDVVLVQGDTTSTLAGALAAFYLQIPVGHLEAGLRTGNMASPFPEEGNRLLTTRLTNFHFAPTQRNESNLKAEGLPDEQIWITGNTVIDALLWATEKVEKQKDWGNTFGSASEIIYSGKPYVLITGHRRESFGEGFQSICRALARLGKAHPEWDFIYPVHLNPNVQKPVNEHLAEIQNIHLINPLSYPAFVYAMNRAKLILTDSGGVQEEAPSLGKPVLVMRENTERPEAVEAGTVKLVGTDEEKIVREAEALMLDARHYESMARAHNPYGDGQAAKKILDILAANI